MSMKKSRALEIESSVVKMYELHPFPSVQDKARKIEDDMKLRLLFQGIKPEDYVGKMVLDAGCGTGGYSCWYARRGSYVTAVDLSEASLRLASEYAQKEGITNIKFERQSVLKLDFPDASFDYVYSMGVLHHTPDPYGGFRELCRVLRPGGVLMVSLYNKFGRFRHNTKQRILRTLAGDDIDRRVLWAKRLFPGTCRSLQKNRGGDPDIILYDAFGIPHESQHSIGEALQWFDHNGIQYLGAFGPVTIRDNLLALKLLQQDQFQGFKRLFDGFSVAGRAVNTLPRIVGGAVGDVPPDDLTFQRPSWFSRASVQFCWFLLGFRFSIFSLAGRKLNP